jgi:hypothetical protein
MLDPTTEARLAAIERDIQTLKEQHQESSQVDSGLLNRIDRFYESFQQERKVQKRSFDDLKIGQIDTSRRLDAIEEALTALVEVSRDHKGAIEALATRTVTLEENQAEQTALLKDIVTLLRGQGKPQTND